MKKLLVLFMILSMVLCFAGCGSVADIDNNASNLDVASVEEVQNSDVSDDGTKTTDEDAYVYGGLSIVLPEGFTVDETTSTIMAYAPDYPARTDNISFTHAGADDISNYTQDVFEQMYASLFGDGFGESKKFEKTKIDGVDAVVYSYTMSVNGVDMEQTQVIVFMADKTTTITFTSVSGDYDDAFSTSINSIKIQK